jgi:hypothetical protein
MYSSGYTYSGSEYLVCQIQRSRAEDTLSSKVSMS